MNEYHFLQLDRKEQLYYKKIIDAVTSGSSSVKPSPFIGSEQITKIATAVNYDHPELFCVDFRHLNFLGTPMGVIYQVNYTVRTAIRSAVSEQVERKISEILDAAVKSNLQGDYEKCRWLHNYLVRNTKYNYEALRRPDDYPDSFNAKGAILDGMAVCEGISKAFKLLCDRLGVDAMIAFGTSSQENFGVDIPHAWNIVKFDSEYTHVDVTWDIGMSESSQFTRYDYFCVSDRWMTVDHVYSSFPECKTDDYSYFSKRNRFFTKGKELKAYLDTEMKRCSSTLYFKVNVASDDFSSIQTKIQDQVSRSITESMNSSYFLEMAPNAKQMCFFFRIKQ